MKALLIIRSGFCYFSVALTNFLNRFRGLALKTYLLFMGCEVGKRLKCKQWPIFLSPPRSIAIGNDVGLGTGLRLMISTGKLVVGNNVNITHNVTISSATRVTIGDYSMIAENVTIRDADHGTDHTTLMCNQAHVSSSISIGRDVWIAAGCAITKGSRIEDGCVIGANSVTTESRPTQPYGIYVGAPIRPISVRK